MNKLFGFFFLMACFLGMLFLLRQGYEGRGFFFVQNIHREQQKKLIIVATTSMLADAVRNIVHNNAHVYSLMGPGIDPHLYRAKESDVHKLAAADMVVYNGLHLEGKMGQVLEGMCRFTTVVNASDVLDKRLLRAAEFENLYDPHIWFDVTLWIKVVRHIQQEIVALDPDHTDIYQKNGDEYIAQLEQLHNYVQQRVNEIDACKRILITAHDAFGYFGDAYGFEVVGLQGLSTDCDISTRDIQELANYIVAKKISTIFVESSISARSMHALREAVIAQGWCVAIGAELYSDALGDEASGVASYIDMVRYNVDAIVNALKN
jgi:manganese/zinc/iron transport system substrate-binding protein